MTFNSFQFWVVFPLLFLLYWAIPAAWKTTRKAYLIGVSYLLYMTFKPAFACLLLGVTLVAYVGGKAVEDKRDGKRALLVTSALVLVPLLIFKYYNFINDNLTALMGYMGVRWTLKGLNWAVPVGISFYTFQAVGYLVDVYYKRTVASRSLLDFTLFMSFFPQLACGPIAKGEEMLPQINKMVPFNYHMAVEGLRMLLWGMFLKLVVADRLGLYVDTVYHHYQYYSGATCLLCSVLYSFQIYADFSGYSLLALGIGRTLGLKLPDNFRQPYFSVSVSDFWRRWHITLSRWLKYCVYIPLGGSRCSKLRSYVNLFLTFIVSGTWHGANWTFIFWGMLHGLFLMIEKRFKLHKWVSHKWWVNAMRIFVTFMLVNFTRVFFRLPSIADAWQVIVRVTTKFNDGKLFLTDDTNFLLMVLALIVLITRDVNEEYVHWMPGKWTRRVGYCLLFAAIITVGVLDSGQFIYVGF